MMTSEVPALPISEIKIVNPRPRSKYAFDQIVTSIATVGLKTPITVSQRERADDGTQYDLVCGQGRLEAFLALGQSNIPAVIINASREDQYLMSLVENIARRPPSHLGLLRETMRLRERGYNTNEIASKLGFASRYIATITALLDNGEVQLLRLVEGGKMPLTVAAEISKGTSADIQRALTEAYEAGDLRGTKLKNARSLIQKRVASTTPESGKKEPGLALTGKTVAREYQDHTRRQRALVKRAAVINERLIIVSAACRTLFADDNFVTLLRAEDLSLVSERLIELTKGV
jgi:ParB family transcriptional regulator, chromosome partitioning protein